MSFDPDTLTDDEKRVRHSIEDLLEQILLELKRIESQLAEITDREIDDDDLD